MSSKSKYKPIAKLLDLEFVDYPGLEVRTRSASIGEIKKAQELNVDMAKKDEDEQLEAFRFFESKLVAWNVVHPETAGDTCAVCGLREDDDLPTTLEGMLCLDISMMIAILFGWIQSVARVSLPKGMSLPSGVNGGLGEPPTDGMPMSPDLTAKLETLQNLGISLTPNSSLD